MEDEEVIRLGCLAQAVISEPRATAESIIEKAKKFENYIKNRSNDNG